MVFVDGLVRVEHQIIVDTIDAFFAGSWVIIIMELGHCHIQIVQPSDEVVAEGFVPFTVRIHPFLVVVLLQFFQKVEQVIEIHGLLDVGCWMLVVKSL